MEAFEVVSDTSGIPVLLEATLAADWTEATRFQTFAWEDRRSAGEAKPYVVANPWGSYSYPQLVSGAELAGAAFRAEGVTPSGTSGWSFDGTPDGRNSYLTVSNPIELAAGQKVIVHGRLRRGAVRVGLLLGQQWFLDVVAEDEGEFWAVLVPPQAGTFQLVVANELPEHSRRQDVVIQEVRIG